MLSLRLYVTGMTGTAEQQIARLRALLDEIYGSDYELTVRDIFTHPNEAYEDAVYATPMLIRRLPPPAVHIIGNLGDRERVLVGLRVEDDGG